MSETKKLNSYEDRPFLVAVNDAIQPVITQFVGETEVGKLKEIAPKKDGLTDGILIIAVSGVPEGKGLRMKNYVTCSGHYESIIDGIERLLTVDPIVSNVIMQAVTQYIIKQGPAPGGGIVN